MPFFRKKPVVVEACQLCETNGIILAIWCGGKCGENTGCVFIPTLEGTMRADIGDWVIRGVKGEFYACKPDIFAATYEAAAKGEGEGR